MLWPLCGWVRLNRVDGFSIFVVYFKLVFLEFLLFCG